MTLLGKINDISIIFGDDEVLQNAKGDIPSDAVIGIVGGNGEGKSSLLSVLSNKAIPASGKVEWIGNSPSISYFQQEDEHFSQTEYEHDEWTYFSKWTVPEGREYAHLSGGEKMKRRLSRVFAENSQVLLLDEPTNHLDQESLAFLKKQILSYNGTILLVSHDRYFLDEVADYIWEVENKKLTIYVGNYSTYRDKKAEKILTQQRLYDAQQSKIQQVEKQITELKNWSSKAHADSTKHEFNKEYYRVKAKKMDVQIRSKKKRLELELTKNTVEKPDEEKDVSFSIEGNKKKGKRVIEAKNLRKEFGKTILLQNASFTIQSKERVGLLGSNGSGKSTFFRMLLGEESFQGDLWKSESMNIGYLRQTVFDLPEEQTPFEFFGPTDFEIRGLIQTLMTNLGFSKEHWSRPISTMSMGERVKLKLMEFMLDQKDVLLLDEPTNHLDLPSREQLEKTLSTFPGTILLVTHDRYFLEKLTNKLLIFEDKSIRKVEMNYSEWMYKNNESLLEKELLTLETERQAVLGELSFLKSNDPRYSKLDIQFNELTKKINELKNK
ncbi:macrolide transport system ATP-binding/permease protein [Psychrobacillus sp. OK028]|uniref:ribosomal protection-like ABC-F family protein n=1 Tax=Psychrobacillus sp. OK028 TaxID=1884359 RepID=UPI0008925DF6|nr:ABC-F type ribosomal protection protein [Psychrobacillus sp. OK028]SDN45605.1 macrolide transport system ATP-binding/permease protein [Psychrobacillus sp. OK028]